MPLRLRIALSTAALMVISLAILGGGVYVTLSRHLNNGVESRLESIYEAYKQDPTTYFIVNDSGRPTLKLGVNPEPFSSSGVYIQVLEPNGNVATRSQNLGAATIEIPDHVLRKNAQLNTQIYTTTTDELGMRVLSGPIVINNEVWYVQVAESLNTVSRTLDALKQTLLVGSLLATLVLSMGAWIIGDAALDPLSRMNQTAREIGNTRDLSQRLDPPATKDEVQDLAETFNDMLARLEESFNAQRRFVADASHELRTPLTALRANSEIMLRQIDSGIIDRDDLTEGLTDVRDEVDRMTRLVQNLLTLARADVGWRPEMETVDLVDVARDAARVASPLARGQVLEFDAPPLPDERSIDVCGNADQIRQLILILLDNAFTYTPGGTRVTLAVGVNGESDYATIAVTDSGPGISPEHLRRIFERFYRADDARTRSTGGAGLGLSIARWIAAIHDGAIDVKSSAGHGTTFTVQLPMTTDGAVGQVRRKSGVPAAVG